MESILKWFGSDYAHIMKIYNDIMLPQCVYVKCDEDDRYSTWSTPHIKKVANVLLTNYKLLGDQRASKMNPSWNDKVHGMYT